MSGQVRLAGSICRNPLAQLYRGDLIALVPSRSESALPRVYNLGLVGGLYLSSEKTQKKERVIDTPTYLEVDELTCSIVVLQEPRSLGLLGAEGGLVFPFSTLKCYN